MDRQQSGGRGRPFSFPWRSRRQVTHEVEYELQFHMDRVAADLREAGWSEADARAEALRRFGDIDFTRQYCRDEDMRREKERRRMTLVDELLQDLRYAVRSLRGSPGFTATALLTLALGIGGNSAIFSVVRGVLLEPLPFHEPDRLLRVYHANPGNGILRGAMSEPDFLDMQESSRLSQSMGAYFFADGLSGLDLTGSGDPERLSAALVTSGFFETLGTRALLGRTLLFDDHVEGRNRKVVLSHGLWARRFGSDRSLVGQSITLNGNPYEIAGIMPAAFTYPAEQSLDVWIPLSNFGPDQIGRVRGAHFLSVVARLKPGVSQSQLRVELSGFAVTLERTYPDNPGWTAVSTLGIRESMLGQVQRPLLVLMVAVAMLLLIACVNIASLLLARANARQRELAVRAALGAGRGRIARQLLTESLVLALGGGLLGVAVAIAAARVLGTSGVSDLPRAPGIGLNGAVLAFTLGVSVLAGVLFGLAPTLRASRGLERSLRTGARGSVGGAGRRVRSGLVIVEVALAVILVVGAGLATKSFARLLSVNPGFRAYDGLVITMSIPGFFETREARLDYYVRVLDAIRAVPGVQAAGSIRDLPMLGRGESLRPEIPGRPTPSGGNPSVQWHHVSTDYFKAMGIPLLTGRTHELSDRADTPPVVVVNEEMARRNWPGEDAVGKVVLIGRTEMRVIGVVGNVRQNGLAEPVEPAMYIHALQNFRVRMTIVARTSGNPLSYAAAVRNAIWQLEPTQTITSVTTLSAVLGHSVARYRLLAWLLAVFGFTGLVLGALGIFGVLAHAVNQRRQEIGVRAALGASPRAVLVMVVRHGMMLALGGVAIGVSGAALLTRFMQTVLYGIEPSDPLTFAQVAVVLMATALLASWLPARRALAIDPVTALRYD
jgi:predicted permease